MSTFDSDEESSVSSFEDFIGEDEEVKSEEETDSVINDDQTTSLYVTPVPKKKIGNQIFIKAPLSGPDMRKTSKVMTPFEYARLIGYRAEMLSRNEPIHPKYRNVESMDLLEIAKMELDDVDIPFPCNIYRPIDIPTLDAKIVEVFNVRELLLPMKMLTQHIEEYLPKSSWRIQDQI